MNRCHNHGIRGCIMSECDLVQGEDMVNHPPHYNMYPFEVLEAIHTLLGTEGYKHYLLGNELKYRLRAGFKGKDKVQEDIDKALFYNKERLKLDSEGEE